MDLKTVLILMGCFLMNNLAHGEGEGDFGGLCRQEIVLQEIMEKCYGDLFDWSEYWGRYETRLSFCSRGSLYCEKIRNVLNIVPSCNLCNQYQSSTERNGCYIGQINATSCSFEYFRKQFRCTKANGKSCEQCTPRIVTSTYSREEEITTTNAPKKETINYSGAEESYRQKERLCEKCICEPCSCKQTGVSVGVAVGLLFIGIVVGSLITAVICICVPQLQRRSTSLRKDPLGESRLNETRSRTPEDTNDSQLAPTILARAVPSAPPPVGQDRYHTLDDMTNQRDSHTYTGLQPESPEYHEPMGDGNTYLALDNQPITGANTVVSPIYNQSNDNVIPSTGKHTSNTGREPIQSTDTNGTANHNYFVLEPQNPDNQVKLSSVRDAAKNRPASEDHQYFVLEKQDGPTPNEKPEEKPYHDYFVLEKSKS